MALTATISVNVPALPDNDIWFANAAAWNNYWQDITADVDLIPATTTVYAAVAFDDTLPVHDFIIDSVNYVVPSKAMFDSLVARVDALNAAFETMRTQMRTAGYITNAQ